MVHIPNKRYEYEKARALRRRGWSYNKIIANTKVAKSTVSVWCKDIRLSNTQKRALVSNSRKIIGQRLGAKANHDKRVLEIASVRGSAKEEITSLDRNALHVAGTMLYWAEGTKTKNTAICNSDPRIIKFMVVWIKNIFGIHPRQLTAGLHIHYQDDEKKIKRYWSKLTGIPLQNFSKSFIKPKGTGHRTNILPNGIIRIYINGKGTGNLRHRILAWAEKVYELAIQ